MKVRIEEGIVCREKPAKNGKNLGTLDAGEYAVVDSKKNDSGSLTFYQIKMPDGMLDDSPVWVAATDVIPILDAEPIPDDKSEEADDNGTVTSEEDSMEPDTSNEADGDDTSVQDEKEVTNDTSSTETGVKDDTPVINSDIMFQAGDLARFHGGQHYKDENAEQGAFMHPCIVKIQETAGIGSKCLHPVKCQRCTVNGTLLPNGVNGYVDVDLLSPL